MLRRVLVAGGEAPLADRRTALQGIAVLTAMIRRLLHLLALSVPLAPLRPRMALPALPRAPSPRRLYRFRLTEAKRERPRRGEEQHEGDESGEAVVVTKSNFVSCNCVVLVHNWQHTKLKQKI
mgnify:CR=1 FL=1